MATTDLLRISSLAGRNVGSASVSIAPAPAAARISLRAPEASLAALDKALGLALPRRPKTSSTKGSRAALWLGPDEWLVVDAEGADLMAACAKAKAFHSAVDISHRNVAILVEGQCAEATVSAGCPQDISPGVFPVGACSRTVLGKIEIVLWRTGESEFRVECWRSFSDYAFTFLADAAKGVS